MLNRFEAKINACGAIADLFGIEYFKSHIENACEALPSDENDDVNFEYFLGFEGNEETGLWTSFAKVLVNRETKECTFLDYRKPNGDRMKNPIKPISFT